MSSPSPHWREGEAHAPVFTGTKRFALRRTLGEGGMGVVYEAWDHERGMAVALKTLRHLDAQNLFRLKSEFRIHADIEHRNLVRLGELMHDAGHWFFTMELVDGKSIRDWFWSEPDAEAIDTSQEIALASSLAPSSPAQFRYDERRVRSGLRQLASGIDALHRAGKVHRDLKPSNVMVTAKHRVVILDLGLAAELAPRDASDKTAVGTAAYVAPEQAMSAAASPASDWYSVGVMLFEALTGKLPIDGLPLEILLRKQHQRPSADALVDAPADLAALCLDLLAIDPALRPDGAAILARLAAPRLSTEDGPSRSPFVGRVAELDALSHALADVDGGGAVTVRIEGASGIGKSALVRQFLEQAVRARPGALILSGRCHERESVPYKGLDGVVDAIARAMILLELGDSTLPPPGETAALAHVFPVLLRVPAIMRVSATLPENPFELRARAFRGLRLLLRKLALRRLVVLTIDDIQWADADSLALLREILHAPGAPRLMLVLTWRGDSPPALAGPVRVIELERLSQAEAEGLVALVAPDRVADAAALATAADGHPMFLRELLRHAAPPRRVRLDDALWARIARMDMSARRILELVAVAGRPLPQSLVIDALGLDPRSSAKWLGVLRAAGLVRTGGARGSDPVEPYHDRVRAAVVARVAPARRRRYHARLAAALTASGLVDKDPLAVVKHLEAAGLTEQAGDLARRAARRSTRAPRFEQIAALCAAALRLGADHGDRDIRRELLIEGAEALACAGRGPEAAAAYLRAADELDGDDGFHCRRSAAEQLLVSGHTAAGLAMLRTVIAAVGARYPRSASAARRELIARTLWIAVRGTDVKVRALADPRHLRRYEVYRAASLGLGMVDPVIGAAFCAAGLMCALRIGDQRRVAYALAYHAMYVAAGGERHIKRARAMCVRAAALATRCRSRLLLAIARAAEGIVEYFAGNLIHAIDVMVDAEEQLRNHTYGTTGELNHLRMFLLFAMRRHGGFGELRPRYDEYVRDALRRGDRYAGTTFRWSANMVWLAADDVERAHAELAAASWGEPERLHLQHWFHARAVTELALYEGDDARLEIAEAELNCFLGGVMDHVQIVRVETSIELARICVRRGDAIGARTHLARIARDRAPYLRAQAELLAAAIASIEGDQDRARRHLDLAITASAYELPVVGALARRRLGELTEGSAGARLVAESDAVLLHHGVAAPTRFAQAFATWPPRPTT